jgi:hypothetical protein
MRGLLPMSEATSSAATNCSLPSLRDFWLLLDSYDWESCIRELEEGACLPKEWHAKYDPVYFRILDIADASELHEQLAAPFEAAMLCRERKPPRPL